MKRVIEITEIDGLTLLGSINRIKNDLKDLRDNFKPKEPAQLISRKEAAEFFGVSTVTIDDWTKKGILTSYKIANRVYFKRHELEQALTEIKAKKNG